MSGERPDLRMSDADREVVFARLNAAAAEGRLTLAEFEERVDGVLRARTAGGRCPAGSWSAAGPARSGSTCGTPSSSHRVVQIHLDTQAGSTTIVLPPGATADIDRVTTQSGTARLKVPSAPEPGSTAPHVVVTGSTVAGSLVVRYERRLGRWTW